MTQQSDLCQRRDNLFVGGNGSTRLCCTYSPNTRWSSGDFFARWILPFLRGKQERERGRVDTHHETTTQKRTCPRTKSSLSQLQSGDYWLYRPCRMIINVRKHLVSSRSSQMLHLARHVCLNYSLGHIWLCIRVWIMVVCHVVSVDVTQICIRFREKERVSEREKETVCVCLPSVCVCRIFTEKIGLLRLNF